MTAAEPRRTPRKPAILATCACGARWAGRSYAHCASCHLTFSSVVTFDAHRHDLGDGRRGCRNPETHRDKDGVLVFGARTDARGVVLWEHTASVARVRAHFAATRDAARAQEGSGPPTI